MEIQTILENYEVTIYLRKQCGQCFAFILNVLYAHSTATVNCTYLLGNTKGLHVYFGLHSPLSHT
jgi:hypothetical protein